MSVARLSQPHTPDAQPPFLITSAAIPLDFSPFALRFCASAARRSCWYRRWCSCSASASGYARAEALRLAGLITAAGYLGSLPGGFLSDRVLGHRRGLVVSLLFLTVSYLLLSLPSNGVVASDDSSDRRK